MLRLLAALTCIYFLSGCAATTPLVLAEGGNHQFLKHKQDVRLRAAAALDEEPDLLTYSLNGISQNKTEDAINLYLKGYGKNDYSQDMKSIAIYQIGLIHMSRLNEQRDDDKAKLYFQRHLIEFPYSILQERIQTRLKLIEKRSKETIKTTPKKIIARANQKKLLAKDITPFDEDLTPMSERAIRDGRLEDANGVYATVYENPGSSDSIKAKALYQLGLIYMSPYNKEQSLKKSTYFFRKIIEEFGHSPQARKAQQRISQLVNKQP